jgi:HK97 family phage portal protein
VAELDVMTDERARVYTFSPGSADERLVTVLGGDDHTTGVAVTPDAAMGVAAIWRAVQLVSTTVGKLPLLLYQREARDDGLPARRLIANTPLAKLLRERPNAEMTAISFWGTLVAHGLQWGNGYAEIERGPGGRPVALWPIHSSRCSPVRLRGEGGQLELRYRVQLDEPLSDGRRTVHLHPDDVLHIPGMTFNGLIGLSVLEYARASMGLTIAADRYGASFFANSGRPSGLLKHPGKLSPEAAERLRSSWRGQYGGGNSQGTPVLENGMEYQPMSLPPDDAQFIATRGIQVLEVARWYGVPPHKLMHMDSATFSNIEHQGAEFREDTIGPWCCKIEQEIGHKLLRVMSGGRMFARFDLDDLVVPSLSERADAYMKLRQAGIMNTDEIRAKEGMSPLPGAAGQTYLHPVNMGVVQADGSVLLPYAPGENAAESNPVPTEPSDEGDENRDTLEALRPVFADVFDRMARREERAKSASKAPDRAGWLSGWAVKHRQWVAEQLLAPMRAAMVAQGRPQDDADRMARHVAARWCEGITQETRQADEPDTAVAAAIHAARWQR